MGKELADLKQRISILYDMELNNYYMQQGIDRLEHNISKLGYRKIFDIPYKDEAKTRENSCGMISCSTTFFLLTFLFLLLNNWGGAVVGGIIALLLVVCIVYIISYSNKQKDVETNYMNECQNYNNLVKLDNHRVEQELKQKENLILQRDALLDKKIKSEELLLNFYNTMDIDRDFRYLIAVGYMNEFLQLGIATKLEGVDGLYYLIKRELRLDQFQYNLNEISTKFDTVIDQNSRIYGELCNINLSCMQMVQAVKQQAEEIARNNDLQQQAIVNLEISAYNQERINRELEYRRFFDK